VVDSTDAAYRSSDAGGSTSRRASRRRAAPKPRRTACLTRTPEGVGQINIRANDVDIQLGSTAYLASGVERQHDDTAVVEGEGHVTVGTKTVAVSAGAQVTFRSMPM